MEILRGLLGLTALIGIAFVFSKHKKKINWQLVGSGVAIQIVLGILVFKVPIFANFFGVIAGFFTQLLSFTDEGARFIFGNLVANDPEISKTMGYIFAFKVFGLKCCLHP